jgi:large subunit ribosomal protein L22
MAATEERTAARATGRYLHVSPYKVRQVLELVRGLPVDDAQRVLQLCEKDAADPVLKLLNSAVANGEHNLALEAEEMWVARAWADEGPTRKWGQPRARGRYFRVRKRTSHVTILLERFDTEELEERRRRDEVTGRGAAVAQRRRAERVRRSRAPELESDVDEDEPEAGEVGDVWAATDEGAVDEATDVQTDAEADTDTDAPGAEPEAEKE